MLSPRLLKRRPVSILAWAVAILLAGAGLATQVPLEWVPSVELPEVRIGAAWPGSSPRAVERYVTAPIERAVQGVEGTAGIESLSQEGRATVTLQVDEGVALGPYVARVNERLALLRDELPDRVTPRLTKRIPEALRDQQGFMTIQLVGPQAPADLRRLADERVAPRLQSLAGVADLVVRGGSREEVLLMLDPGQLAAYGIPVPAARQRLAEATTGAVYGRLRSRGHATLLLTPATSEVERLQDLVVSEPGEQPLVRLRDVGTLERRPAPRRSISRIDGDPVVTLTLDRAPGSPMLGTARQVRARVDALDGSLPDGTRLLVADDKSEDVRGQLRDLTWRGGLGLALVVLVLLFLLRSVRAVAITLFSVAVALAVAVACMPVLGLTLNLLTIAGLVLVFGLLVDNAVVMTEQVVLQRERMRARIAPGVASSGSLHTRASVEALRAVGLPLVGGTLTTMAVMAPLVYLSGELRALFLPFGVLTALALGASLISAAVLVPVCGRWLPPPAHRVRGPRWLRAGLQMPFRLAARAPRGTLVALALLLGTPLWLLPETMDGPEEAGSESTSRAVAHERWADLYNATLGRPAVRELRDGLDPALGGVVRPFVQDTEFGETYNFQAAPEVYVRLGFPPGNPIQRADSLLQVFEQTALASASVRRTLARIGERQAYLRIQFTDPSLDTAEPYILRERLIQRAVLLAGIDVSVGGLLPQGYYSRSGMGVSGFTVIAYGPNYDDLAALGERFARVLKRGSRRVATVNTNAGRYGRQTPRQVLRVRYDADAQARAGVSPQQLTARLRPVLATRFPDFYANLDGRAQMPVRIAVAGADTLDIRTFADRPLLVGDSTRVKLGPVAARRVEDVPSRIIRENQRYKRYLRIDYRGPVRMGRDYVESVLDGFATPPGYTLEFRGGGFFGEEGAGVAWWIVLGTVGLVFLVTAAVLESWRLPLVVLLSVPTAAVGVAIGFLWADIAFAEGAFIGTVLLVGIAANDSILLVGRYRQLQARHPHRAAGLLARLAVRERLRPMWTTTLSTSVAMLPLIVFPQESDFWLGLAVTVTGGLLAATLLAPLASVALLREIGRADTGITD
jgi:multidrug efflux pump subunit AcrB